MIIMNSNIEKIRLHLPAIPHTITSNEFSHCAFTGKVLRFSPMMQSVNYEVYHYGIETSESGATKQIDLMTKNEWNELRKKSLKFLNPTITDEQIETELSIGTNFIGNLANVTTPLYAEFNKRLNLELKKYYRSKSTDIICLPFGHAHEAALHEIDCVSLESGIGYENSYKNYRIFESYAILHSTMSKEQKQYQHYWFVIPNYYNIIEWPLNLNPNNKTVGYFGRICDIKGCNIVVEIAQKFPHINFILCGQGDPSKYLTLPNIHYKPPIHGIERSEYLGNLMMLIAPTLYIEPFCGVNVEAQLCGTPVLTNEFGAFVETIEQFKTGLLAHTLTDYCHGIQMAIDGKFDRNYIHQRACKIYSMYNVAHKYKYVFDSILDIHNGNNGWYSNNNHIKLLQESDN